MPPGNLPTMPPREPQLTSGLVQQGQTLVMGMDAFARGNLRPVEEVDSEGESSVSAVKHKIKLTTGMIAKPTDNIKSQEVWPHYNLNYGYVTQQVEFYQLSYEQYVVGESTTLLKCVDPNEIRGRLNLLVRISYLKQKGYSWPNLCTLYAAIVNHIEKHETYWVSDWRHIEEMVLEAAVQVPGEKSGGKGGKSTKAEVFYCHNFNRPEGCQLTAPHEANIGCCHRQVQHFCARCWNAAQEMHEHSKCDNTCPLVD